MTIANANQVVTRASGEVVVIYSGQEIPATSTPWKAPVPTSAQLLSAAQATQMLLLVAAYRAAIQHPVSYTSKGGVTETYQADNASQDTLAKELAVYLAMGVTPPAYYWIAADNVQVPFVLADLQGLVGAMGVQGWPAFEHFQTQKAAVMSPTATITSVQAVVW